MTYHIHRGVAVKQLQEADVRDLYRTREALELMAIECSSEASPEQLETIARTVDEAEIFAAARDWKRVGTLDILFHQQIVGLVGSERIEEFFRRIVAELRLGFAVFEASNHARFVPWNRTMAALLLAGDREACAREMRDYLATAEAMILNALSQQTALPSDGAPGYV